MEGQPADVLESVSEESSGGPTDELEIPTEDLPAYDTSAEDPKQEE